MVRLDGEASFRHRGPADFGTIAQRAIHSPARWGRPLTRLSTETSPSLCESFGVGANTAAEPLIRPGNFCDRIAEIDEATLVLLNETMPLYRRVFWDRHNEVNREWMAAAIEMARPSAAIFTAWS